MERAVTTEGLSEFKRSLRALVDSRLISPDGFQQQRRSKLEHSAIVPTVHRVRDPIRFGSVEEQNVIRVGNELASCDLFQKHARARKDNVMSARIFFRAMVPAFPTVTHVVVHYAPAAIKPVCP